MKIFKDRNFLKKVELTLFLILIFVFVITKLQIISYGLPFFSQEDENAFLKSTISFISFITGIKFILGGDPLIAPLINLILTLKVIFINEFIINSLSLSEIKQKIYQNSSILILYGRYISLLISTLSLVVLFLIFKKLKIHFYIYFPMLVSISLSLFLMTVSIVNGKNSFYLLFFLIQLYFFIKYYLKINNFNKKTYLFFAILASLAWGTNYWCAIVSFYGILILHYKKFRLKHLNYFFYFALLFIFLGLLPNLFLSDLFFSFFLGDNYHDSFSLLNFLENIKNKTIYSLEIIYNTEKFIFLFIPILILYLSKNLVNKKIIIILGILIIEPILLFSLAEKVIPELRYFSGMICLMFILSGIMIKDLSIYYKTKVLIILFLVFNFTIIYQKSHTFIGVNKILKKNHTFINFFEKNKNINSEILYIIPRLNHRKNFKNLVLYKNLHEKNIIKNKQFERDNYEEILKKIKKNIPSEVNKDLNIYSHEFFSIEDYKMFFLEVKKSYKYVAIQQNNLNSDGVMNFIKLNFKKNIFPRNVDVKDLSFNNGIRDIFKFLYNGGSIVNLNDNFFIGNNYVLYSINTDK